MASYKIINEGDKHLTVRSIKKLIDGALGPHGAWLLEPYTDLPTSTGLNTESVENITRTAEIAIENGFQLCVHAIGDRANRETLDIYQKKRSRPIRTKPTCGGASSTPSTFIPMTFHVCRLGVIASMQGIHCTSDGPWVPVRMGDERTAEGAYVWQKLLKSGAVVTNGTDAPVEDVNPLASYYATVSRKFEDGTVFYPDQRMSREEALESYTLSNAYAAFEKTSRALSLRGSWETSPFYRRTS